MGSLIAFDLIHFIYNLAYPALLGTFFYQLFEKRPGGLDLIARVLVICIFSLDFIWGRKIYDWAYGMQHSVPNAKTLWITVFCEAAILATLCFAFNASTPLCFLFGITAFALAVIGLFVFNGNLDINFWPSRILVAFVFCGALAALVEWKFNNQVGFMAGIAASYIFTASYYYFSFKQSSWQAIIMLPSGRTL